LIRINQLSAILSAIEDIHAKGEINNDYYTNLKNEISKVYGHIYKDKIESLNSKVDDRESNRIQLDKIKDDITDAYTEGKISEQHYNLLKEKIASCNDIGQSASISSPFHNHKIYI
jgi:hypothetical protein